MKGNITIGRSSDDLVRVRIRDVLSRIEFAEIALTPQDFAYAITGLAEVEGELEVRGLQHVGKRRITESREIECPMHSYDKKELADWLVKNAQEEGWTISTYLGSQGSVSRRGDKTLLRYSVTRYEDAT